MTKTFVVLSYSFFLIVTVDCNTCHSVKIKRLTCQKPKKKTIHRKSNPLYINRKRLKSCNLKFVLIKKNCLGITELRCQFGLRGSIRIS